MVLVLLAACAPATTEAPLPTAWSYQERAGETPILTTAELEEAVGEVLDALLRADPTAVHDAFTDARAHGDASCPVESDHSNQVVVSGDCTTADGYTYLGTALLNRLRNMQIELNGETHYHEVFDWATGFLRVVGPDGYLVEVLGDSLYRQYAGEDGALTLEMYLWGDFQAQGGVDADPWLGERMGVWLYMDGVKYPDGNEANWAGGLSRLDGIAKAAVLDELRVSGRADGCVSEGVGTIELLDAYGTWYTVVFDGDVTCDGCGAATSEGAALGQVCVDMTPLADWGERPWY